MPKGFFSQGFCFLTDGQTRVGDIASVLRRHDFSIVKEVAGQSEWAFGGPGLVVSYRPEVNGYVEVDLVGGRWPDTMGNPTTDLEVFGAWSMGYFGPFAYPGGLERAIQHARAWDGANIIGEDHRGFIRLRLSYNFGLPDAPVFSGDCDPTSELRFLSQLALAILEVPGVRCYFNPNGEVLLDQNRFGRLWVAALAQQQLPFPLWMNIRYFNLSDSLGFMDTVGNGQMDVSDVEAIFPLSHYHPNDVDYYLRNVTHYLLEAKPELKTGETIDGPGEHNLSWTLELRDDGVVQPPRKVLRLYPQASSIAVNDALAGLKG
jgi:hypothetical protein